MKIFIRMENNLRNVVINRNVHTNVLGIGRSILAFGTFLTLLLNPVTNFLYQLEDNSFMNPLLNPMTPINKFNFFLLLGSENIFIMKTIAVIILAVVISGYFIKITSLLHWWICLSFLLFSSAIDGGDQIASNITLLLIPVCLFDNRKNHWDIKKKHSASPINLIPISFIFLIRLQVAIIYFHSAVGKFPSKEWINGTALFYWFNHSVFGMPTYLEPITNYFLSKNYVILPLTFSVFVFELILFLALGMEYEKRKYLFIPAVIFHLLIIQYLGIFSFFFSITAGLIFLLLDINQEIKIKILSKKQPYEHPAS